MTATTVPEPPNKQLTLSNNMSPNTPAKQRHDLKVRPTYLGEYTTNFNKERQAMETVPVMNNKPITSRSGTVYQRTTAGNLVKI